MKTKNSSFLNKKTVKPIMTMGMVKVSNSTKMMEMKKKKNLKKTKTKKKVILSIKRITKPEKHPSRPNSTPNPKESPRESWISTLQS